MQQLVVTPVDAVPSSEVPVTTGGDATSLQAESDKANACTVELETA